MQVDLRLAGRNDIPELMPLLEALYQGDIGSQFMDILDEYIGSENHLFAVATSNVGIVGLLIGSYRLDIDYECRAGLLDAFVVDEKFRGKGIGKCLLRYFAQWARSRECTVLQVLNGRRALEFYESRGFRERPVILHQVPIEELVT